MARRPIRLIEYNEDNVNNAYPMELLIDPKTGTFGLVLADPVDHRNPRTVIENHTPGKLTVKLGNRTIIQDKFMAESFTIPIADMIGATENKDGVNGLVPVPLEGYQNRYLAGDGTWKEFTGVTGIAKFFTATVSTSWDGDTAPFTQTISLDGILETDRPFIMFLPTNDFDRDEELSEQFSYICRCTTENDQITVYASEKTEQEVSIILFIVR